MNSEQVAAELKASNYLTKCGDLSTSVDPLCEVVAGLKLSGNLLRVHALVLGQVLRILPLEKLHAILGIRLTPKVAIGCSVLVFGFTQSKGHPEGTWAAIKGDLDDVRDVVSSQVTLRS